MDNQEDTLRRHLAALFYQFRDRPFLLAQYFLKYDSLTEGFKNTLVDNPKLGIISEEMKNNNDTAIPYFHTLEEMQKFYNKMFENETTTNKVHPILGASTQEEALKKQLEQALSKEDYERAAQIRDYMKTLGMDLDNEI